MALPAIIAGEIITSLAASAIGNAFTKSQKGEDTDTSKTYKQLNEKLEEQFQEFPKDPPKVYSTPVDERLSALKSTFSTHKGNLEAAVEESSLQSMRAIYEMQSGIDEKLDQMNERLKILNQNIMATSQMVQTYGTSSVEATAQFGNPKKGFLSTVSGALGTVTKIAGGIAVALGLGALAVKAIGTSLTNFTKNSTLFDEGGLGIDPDTEEEFSEVLGRASAEVSEARSIHETASANYAGYQGYSETLKKSTGVSSVNAAKAINSISGVDPEITDQVKRFINDGKVSEEEKAFMREHGLEYSDDDSANVITLLKYLIESGEENRNILQSQLQETVDKQVEYIESWGGNPERDPNYFDRFTQYNSTVTALDSALKELKGLDSLNNIFEYLSGLDPESEEYQRALQYLVLESSTYASEGSTLLGGSKLNAQLKNEERTARSDLFDAEDREYTLTNMAAQRSRERILDYASNLFTMSDNGTYVYRDDSILTSFDDIWRRGNKASDGVKAILRDLEDWTKLEEKLQSGKTLSKREQRKYDSLQAKYGFGGASVEEGSDAAKLMSEIREAMSNYYSLFDLTDPDHQKILESEGLWENGQVVTDPYRFLEWLSKVYENKGYSTDPMLYGSDRLYQSFTNTLSSNPMVLVDPEGNRVTDRTVLSEFSSSKDKMTEYIDAGYKFAGLGQQSRDVTSLLWDLGYKDPSAYTADISYLNEEMAERIAKYLADTQGAVILNDEDMQTILSGIYAMGSFTTSTILQGFNMIPEGSISYNLIGSSNVNTQGD